MDRKAFAASTDATFWHVVWGFIWQWALSMYAASCSKRIQQKNFKWKFKYFILKENVIFVELPFTLLKWCLL